MLELRGVTKRFGDRAIFENLDLAVEDGAFLVVTGASGSGKTTLLNVMGGLEKPDAGAVFADGQPLRGRRRTLLFHRRRAGFLFQNYALMEDATVRRNMLVALAYRKADSRSERAAAVERALATVGLPGVQGKKVYQLSGGEQQRVALARLTLQDPAYVFADEPTGNLDAANRDLVLGRLAALNAAGKTVVVVTHDPAVANAACVTQRVEL